jgi:hypothetical protein
MLIPKSFYSLAEYFCSHTLEDFLPVSEVKKQEAKKW